MLSTKRLQPFIHLLLAVALVFGAFHAFKFINARLSSAEGMEDMIDVDVEKDMPSAESSVIVSTQDLPGAAELGSSDLLPMSNLGTWNDIHPGGIGSQENTNFLNAGHHTGINQLGQSLRNANHDLRSSPANPQKVVSPWLNTTITDDALRRPLEVGSACSAR